MGSSVLVAGFMPGFFVPSERARLPVRLLQKYGVNPARVEPLGPLPRARKSHTMSSAATRGVIRETELSWHKSLESVVQQIERVSESRWSAGPMTCFTQLKLNQHRRDPRWSAGPVRCRT
jgi:hypothetical protein